MTSVCSYHIGLTLSAVELRQPSDGSRVGTIAHIPAGSSIEVGPSVTSPNGMIEIDWIGRKYAVFLEDLQERADMEDEVSSN